jgi:peptidoglycan-associated lipoprotein
MFKKNNYSYIAFVVVIGLVLASCSGTKSGPTGPDKAFAEGEYEKAIVAYLKQPSTASTYFQIAEAYRLSNRPVKAAEYYQKAKTAGSKVREVDYHLAYAAKMNGQYSQAKQILEAYLKRDSLDPLSSVLAKKELLNMSKIDSLSTATSPYVIKPMEGLNTKGAEFSPILYNGELIFTASRKENIYTANNLPYLGLYKASLLASQQAAKVERFSAGIFDETVNEGTITFNKEGNVMVFAKGNTGKKKGAADVDLYASTRGADGIWTVPQIIAVSDSAAWDSCPAFSADGRTLYFASNRDGGVGGIDIYRVSMDAAGRFGTAQNMGRVINTPGDDMFPFVGKDGRLFFASNGHPGFGGLDLYVATRKDGKIAIDNLGLPMNSKADDFALSKFENKKGYFASNRDGGQGDDDIYYFEDSSPEPKPEIVQNEKPKPNTDPNKPTIPAELKTVRYFLAGNIKNKEGQNLDSVKIQLIDLNTTLSTANAETVEDGNFGKFNLETETEYTILIERKGYFTKRIPFTMVGREIPQEQLSKAVTDTTFNINSILEKPSLNLVVNDVFYVAPIYYDLNKADIRIDAANELDKIVLALNDNPKVKIELGSHTDSRSSNEYNQTLSQRRAESAVKYIISKGIATNRITAKGYGESQLVNRCADGIDCSEEEHQANRRTEFKVVGFLD